MKAIAQVILINGNILSFYFLCGSVFSVRDRNKFSVTLRSLREMIFYLSPTSFETAEISERPFCLILERENQTKPLSPAGNFTSFHLLPL